MKDRPAMAGGKAVWLETVAGLSSVAAVPIPSLQAVFPNRNAVAVTDLAATYEQTSSHKLLKLWNGQYSKEGVGTTVSFTPPASLLRRWWWWNRY